MICDYCKNEVEPVVSRGWNAGGMKQVVKKCPCCKENVCKKQAFYSYKEYDFENLPILFDDRGRNKCAIEGCENHTLEGTMWHHFYPKYIFGKELAEKGPKAYLCFTHHMTYWHAKLTPNMGGHKE